MTELGPSPLASPSDAQISVDDARARIAAGLRPMAGHETVPLAEALGRVLAEDLISTIDVPAHDNSAMDGFAFRGAELRSDGDSRFVVVATVMAGDARPVATGPGDCVRIMTGAVMPEGLDTVVPLELCREAGGVVHVAAGVLGPGENRRRRGEDLGRGQPALGRGRVLRPADLGLAASLGVTALSVVRRLKVALFSTGDELREAGQPLAPGCIYDSNRHSLAAALRRMGLKVVDLGLVADDPAALEATLATALREADVVLTSGGVSMGDADHTRTLLARMGEVAFWKVAMRPGRPFAFGALRRAPGEAPAWLFALPGNPVAALVTFYAFAQEALWRLAGASQPPVPRLRARCTAAIRKRPGRTEYQRAIVEPAPDGQGWQVRLTGSQGSGVLRSMSEANALLVLGHDQGSVAAGEMVEVWLFDGLV
ncbi:MAG: gephyrin-like molybdotransferase Glp [Burkholderiaceae bacterium]